MDKSITFSYGVLWRISPILDGSGCRL